MSVGSAYLPNPDESYRLLAHEGRSREFIAKTLSLPADILKIDQSFVRDMLDNPDDLAIVESVIGLTQAFSSSVIAEGDVWTTQRETFPGRPQSIRRATSRASTKLCRKPTLHGDRSPQDDPRDHVRAHAIGTRLIGQHQAGSIPARDALREEFSACKAELSQHIRQTQVEILISAQSRRR